VTPFHLRERIKKVLERVLHGQKSEDKRFSVTFVLPDDSEQVVETEEHYSLAMASQLLKTPILTPCPDGRCGGCQVTVLAGAQSLQEPGKNELEALDQAFGKDRDPALRLACHARLRDGGAKVRIHRVWRLQDIQGS
jgi:ferredoxin